MSRRLRSATAVLAAVLALAGAFALGRPTVGTAAQDATPAADGATTLPIAPDPELCETEPRPIAEFEAFLGAPASVRPGAVVVTAGEPADAATVAAVTATVVELAACYNAAGPAGTSGLYTDAGFAEDFGLITQGDIDFFAEGLEADPFAEGDARAGVVAVFAVQVLADGRVAAIVESRESGQGRVDLFIFAEEDGRYLIDHWVDEPFDIAPDFRAFAVAEGPAPEEEPAEADEAEEATPEA